METCLFLVRHVVLGRTARGEEEWSEGVGRGKEHQRSGGTAPTHSEGTDRVRNDTRLATRPMQHKTQETMEQKTAGRDRMGRTERKRSAPWSGCCWLLRPPPRRPRTGTPARVDANAVSASALPAQKFLRFPRAFRVRETATVRSGLRPALSTALPCQKKNQKTHQTIA